MPELPEVEAARRSVQQHCVGRRIASAVVEADSLVIDGISPQQLRDGLVGRVVTAAGRKGKNLWMELDRRPWPTFHFGSAFHMPSHVHPLSSLGCSSASDIGSGLAGMTGHIMIQGEHVAQYMRGTKKDPSDWPPKFHKLVFKMDNDVEVAFCDGRRLARIRLLDDVGIARILQLLFISNVIGMPVMTPPISELGWDALLELPNPLDLASQVTKRKAPVKAVLMDQGVAAGIGNWVADEVLYQARVHPAQPANTLLAEQCEGLHRSIKYVLETAVDAGSDSKNFPKNWLFHVRWSKKPGILDGTIPHVAQVPGTLQYADNLLIERFTGRTWQKIHFETIGGRTSAFVPAIQRMPLGLVENDKPKRAAKKRKKEDGDEDVGGEPLANAEEKPRKKAGGARGAKTVKARAVEEPELLDQQDLTLEGNLPATQRRKRGDARAALKQAGEEGEKRAPVKIAKLKRQASAAAEEAKTLRGPSADRRASRSRSAAAEAALKTEVKIKPAPRQRVQKARPHVVNKETQAELAGARGVAQDKVSDTSIKAADAASKVPARRGRSTIRQKRG
eukprot:SM000231S07476  [mRNA]  locus=s231:4653:7750:+ [translate_table: standard]